MILNGKDLIFINWLIFIVIFMIKENLFPSESNLPLPLTAPAVKVAFFGRLPLCWRWSLWSCLLVMNRTNLIYRNRKRSVGRGGGFVPPPLFVFFIPCLWLNCMIRECEMLNNFINFSFNNKVELLRNVWGGGLCFRLCTQI